MFLSQKPHPPGTLVENKGQTPIRKDCQKTVDALFSVFLGANPAQFRPSFSVFYCSVGRGLQAFPITV
jgi:hypothetical protein